MIAEELRRKADAAHKTATILTYAMAGGIAVLALVVVLLRRERLTAACRTPASLLESLFPSDADPLVLGLFFVPVAMLAASFAVAGRSGLAGRSSGPAIDGAVDRPAPEEALSRLFGSCLLVGALREAAGFAGLVLGLLFDLSLLGLAIGLVAFALLVAGRPDLRRFREAVRGRTSAGPG